MISILYITLAVLMVVAADPLKFTPSLHTWESFKGTFNKQYAIGEELRRKSIFNDNVQKIVQHNMEADMGKHSYWLGVNQFADLTNDEFRQRMNGYKKASRRPASSTFLAPENLQSLPDTVDWRTKGYVTPVKNQGSCGSCWAFSTTGSLEGQHFRQTGKLVSLSEQELVDCAREEGNAGCGGGEMSWAFDHIKHNHGIDTEKCYPYEGENDKCRFKSSCIGATVKGYVNVTVGDEAALKTATATVGPISVGIDASSLWFQFYRWGVYDHSWCSSTSLDHGVLVVGYGHQSGKDYWLVKNSWGTWWGMSGYIKMVRNKHNQCGIATDALYPLV